MAIRKSSISGTPKGATADRPASPSIGDTFNNGTLGVEEIYTASGWVAKSSPAAIPVNVVATNQGTGRAYNNGQASVAFDAGSGGGLIADYVVTPSPATSPTTFTGSSSPITVTGLQSSTQYTYTVQGRNNFGTSLSSAASSGVTATTVPQAPTLSATGSIDGSGNATITITPGATGGSSITQYSIISNPATTTQTTSNTTYTFTGLTVNTAYTFTATATNANGTSLSSSASNSVTPVAPFSVNYLVVAGGGGGWGSSQSPGGSGGGAGGLRSTMNTTGGGGSLESTVSLSNGVNYSVTVGAGGVGGFADNNYGSHTVNTNGSNSIFSTITSTGGGKGGGFSGGSANTGGSGGGAAFSGGTGAAGTSNQGYAGGNNSGTDNQNGAGGGGAGAAGGSPTAGDPGTSGSGGAGVAVSITGSSVTYAGGGAGGTGYNNNLNAYGYRASGGAGGGGAGGYNNEDGGRIINGVSGTANTGGGGGGAGAKYFGRPAPYTGGNGGSGIVIVRYPSSRTLSVGAGLTTGVLNQTVGSDKYTTFTAGTGTISFS